MDACKQEPTLQWLEVDGTQPARLATESCGEGQAFIWGHALMGSMAQDLDGILDGRLLPYTPNDDEERIYVKQLDELPPQQQANYRHALAQLATWQDQ